MAGAERLQPAGASTPVEPAAHPEAATPSGPDGQPQPPKQTGVGGGGLSKDTVVLLRRKMQRERKDQLLELRSSLPRPWTAPGASSRQLVQPVAAGQPLPGWLDVSPDRWAAQEAHGAPEAGNELKEAKDTGGKDGSLLATEGATEPSCKKPPIAKTIARFHRDMVRREVWRQKFDFLYKQMQQEMEQEAPKGDAAKPRRQDHLPMSFGNRELLAALKAAGLAPPSVTGAECAASELGEAHEGKARPTSRQRPRTRQGEQPALEPVQSDSSLEVPQSKRPATSHCAQRSDKAENHFWRFVDPLRSSKVSRPRPTSSTGTSRPAKGLQAGVFTVPLPLRVSASTPSLPMAEARSAALAGSSLTESQKELQQVREELQHVRAEYYEGNEMIMHEDILHRWNPRIFPLRSDLSKPFPLPTLAAIAVR